MFQTKIIMKKMFQTINHLQLGRLKRIWHLSPMQTAKVHTSLRIRRQKARSLAPPNGWACAVKICHDGMLKDTNSLDAAKFI